LDLWAAILAVPFLWLLLLVISAAWKDGTAAWMSAAFGIVVAFLFLHGVGVLHRVRRKGRVKFGKVLVWLLALSLVFSLLLLPGIYFGDAELVLEGVDMYTPLGGLLALLAIWLVFFIVALGMLCAACSAMWFLTKVLRWIVPGFLSDVRKVKFSRRDGPLARVEVWAVAFPRVLDPSTLRLDPQPIDDRAAKDRFVQAMLWQLVLGMILAVYISLNPVLLQTMTFSQTFGLVSITSILVPLLLLPWSTLEALGGRVDGVREDFYLHKGARTRMMQTVVALGTLFLILRLAVQDIGADVIFWRLAGYSLTLFIVSGLVSFAYFNYFENELVEDLRNRLTRKGF
jgi:hypothetical protein